MRAGETRVILGAAGSGKTVLLKTALGLVRPDRGTVSVFGDDITRRTEQELFDLRSRIGMLFQEGGLFDSLTIEENVAYPLVNQQRARRMSPEAGSRTRRGVAAVRRTRAHARQVSQRAFRRHAPPRRHRARRGDRAAAGALRFAHRRAGPDHGEHHHRPDRQGTRCEEHDHRAWSRTAIRTERCWRIFATIRRAANWSRSGATEAPPAATTTFMVMREGRLVFEGTQDQLEASRDPYISKFARQSSE